MPFKTFVRLGTVLLFFAGFSSAWPHPAEALVLNAERTTSGAYQIEIVPSAETSHAILVRALPSGTLMVAIVDSAFRKTAAGEELDAAILREGARAYVDAGSLLEIVPRALVDPPPPSDHTIKVVVWGTRNGQELSNFTMAEVRSAPGLESLSFSAAFDAGKAEDLSVCCRCGSPPRNCGCQKCPGGRVLCDCIGCEASCY